MIWESSYPGTVPFLGVPAAIELQIQNNKLNALLTFPISITNIDEVADKAAKYFDGEIISKEPRQIVILLDMKMTAYTLLFAFREHYNNC